MPKIVDKNQQRLEIAKAALQIIQVKGIEKITNKDIALKAECSPSLIPHYFKDREDLLATIFELIFDQTISSIERLKVESTDDKILENIVLLLSNSDSEYPQAESNITLHGWSKSKLSKQIEEKSKRNYARMRLLLQEIICQLQEKGVVHPHLDSYEIADTLVVFGDGLCVQAALISDLFDETYCRQLITRMLSPFIIVK